MTRKQALEKVKEIFVDLLDDEKLVVTEETSMQNCPDWDSLMHITLIASIETELRIHLSSEDIAHANTVSILLDVIMKEIEKK